MFFKSSVIRRVPNSIVVGDQTTTTPADIEAKISNWRSYLRLVVKVMIDLQVRVDIQEFTAQMITDKC